MLLIMAAATLSLFPLVLMLHATQRALERVAATVGA